MRTILSSRRIRAALVLVAACGALGGPGLRPVARAERPPSLAERIVAGLEATSVRENRLVEAFATNKTFTILHEGKTHAHVLAALQFKAPDVKVFTVLESRGSDFIRTRVINRMMTTEVELARDQSRARIAISPDNYEFGSVREDGDAYVLETLPRRRDELLFKGLVWITKDGFHLKRIEGEPTRNPSFWIRRIRFVVEFEPVNGVWMEVRARGRVTMRWLGEYQLQSECGPYHMLLTADAPASRF